MSTSNISNCFCQTKRAKTMHDAHLQNYEHLMQSPIVLNLLERIAKLEREKRALSRVVVQLGCDLDKMTTEYEVKTTPKLSSRKKLQKLRKVKCPLQPPSDEYNQNDPIGMSLIHTHCEHKCSDHVFTVQKIGHDNETDTIVDTGKLHDNNNNNNNNNAKHDGLPNIIYEIIEEGIHMKEEENELVDEEASETAEEEEAEEEEE